LPRLFILSQALLIAIGIWLAPVSAGAEEFKYTGAKDCGRCHKKELMGDQLAAWKKGPHAEAFEALAGDEALKVAKERGMTVPPQESDDCLRCHATAFGLEKSQIHKKPLAMSDGVQCESCHGPGSGYRKKKTMADHDKAVAAGLWEPGKDEKVCTSCHNSDSPTWDEAKGFDYEAMKEKIAHPIPEDVKGHYLEREKEARKARGGSDDDDDEEEDD
jgi:nitrate/TMAO reductase-like tetraheme cytochrome c subunit